MALKGTADILTIDDQIVFKAYHKYVMHSNIKPKSYNCIIEHSTYQISDLSRQSYKTQDKSSSNAFQRIKSSNKSNLNSMWPWTRKRSRSKFQIFSNDMERPLNTSTSIFLAASSGSIKDQDCFFAIQN